MSFYTAVITLFLVMDPLGNVPAFLSILKHYDSGKRNLIVIRESIIAFVILSIFLFAGHDILSGLAISQEALGVSGGIILFLIAIKMIFPPEEHNHQERTRQEPFIVPLAIPFIAGPSSMATVMLMTSNTPGQHWLWLGALGLASLVSMLILLFSSQILRLCGQKILHAIERLMGMILATLAVQMLLTGIKHYFMG